jgi:hypothetical protein
MLLGLSEVVLDETFWQKACELRVAVPAVVVSFNTATQTAVVQPAIRDTLLVNLVPTPTDLPQLSNVPVLGYRGGGFSITLPIKAGDEGVVIFSDLAIDSWWQSGGTQNNQVERRRHDLSDGMFLPCGWSQPRVLSTYNANSLEIRQDNGQCLIRVSGGVIYATPDNGTVQFQLSPGVITLTGAVSVTGSLTVNGKNFDTHIHSGVTTGSGNTGPLV